jgi:HSP20 family protein
MIYRRFYNTPAVSFRNAFEQLDRMRRQFDQLFTEDSGVGRGLLGAGVFPQINLTEDEDRFYLRAELPGVKTDDLDMQATAKNISISGERRIEAEGEGVRYHRREREAGKFSRIVAMPTEIDPDRIEARMQDGILTIRVPKADAVKPRRITIN